MFVYSSLGKNKYRSQRVAYKDKNEHPMVVKMQLVHADPDSSNLILFQPWYKSCNSKKGLPRLVTFFFGFSYV